MGVFFTIYYLGCAILPRIAGGLYDAIRRPGRALDGDRPRVRGSVDARGISQCDEAGGGIGSARTDSLTAWNERSASRHRRGRRRSIRVCRQPCHDFRVLSALLPRRERPRAECFASLQRHDGPRHPSSFAPRPVHPACRARLGLAPSGGRAADDVPMVEPAPVLVRHDGLLQPRRRSRSPGSSTLPSWRSSRPRCCWSTRCWTKPCRAAARCALALCARAAGPSLACRAALCLLRPRLQHLPPPLRLLSDRCTGACRRCSWPSSPTCTRALRAHSAAHAAELARAQQGRARRSSSWPCCRRRSSRTSCSTCWATCGACTAPSRRRAPRPSPA